MHTKYDNVQAFLPFSNVFVIFFSPRAMACPLAGRVWQHCMCQAPDITQAVRTISR